MLPVFLSIILAALGALTLVIMQDTLGKMRWTEVAIFIPAGIGIVELVWLGAKTRANPFRSIGRYYGLLRKKRLTRLFWGMWAVGLIGRPIYLLIIIYLGALTWSVVQSLKVFLMPVAAFLVLSENTFKKNFIAAFTLVLVGVVGSNMLKAEGNIDALANWPFLAIAAAFIALNCVMETLGKRIHLTVGAESKEPWYILSVDTTGNLLQIVTWSTASVVLALTGAARYHRFLEPASPASMATIASSKLMLNIVAYVAMAAVYFYIETFIRTVKEFPIAFKEPLVQLKIIFTALFVSVGSILPLSIGVVKVTAMHFVFYALILAGVTLLSLSHWKTERAARLARDGLLAAAPE